MTQQHKCIQNTSGDKNASPLHLKGLSGGLWVLGYNRSTDVLLVYFVTKSPPLVNLEVHADNKIGEIIVLFGIPSVETGAEEYLPVFC